MNAQDKTILVVDDALFMVTVIQKALVDAGYRVQAANSGEEAIKLINKQRPDLILLDVVMPGMNGFEVCAYLRNDLRYSLIPIIIITGQSAEEDKLLGLEAGADDYVTKPFSSRELLARVHNTLLRLERMRDVNPLSGLRGNNEIQLEIARRIGENRRFAALYFDLNSFKPYNDTYGFEAGDNVLRMTSDVIVEAIISRGIANDFVGHIGGDDFIALVDPANAVAIAKQAISDFESKKLAFYSAQDAAAGFMMGHDREGNLKKLDLVGLSVAILMNEKDPVADSAQLGERAAELKGKAKQAACFYAVGD
jgi:diguanylate cyclase (GGDEF) domain